MKYVPQSVIDEKKVADYKLRIEKLIDEMNIDNIGENQRKISILKYKIKALMHTPTETVMDYGVRIISDKVKITQ